MTSHQPRHQSNPTASALTFLGIMLGVLTGFTVLQGDDLGRVNLLYLLLLFSFIPAVSLLLTLSVLFRNNAKGLISTFLESPLWPAQLRTELLSQTPGVVKKHWLLMQSQFFALAFAMGNLIVLMMVLLGSDVNFIWRSSLLDAETLLPLLEILSLPWLYWSEAQPSLELLQQTQDFRLNSGSLAELAPGLWWKYVVAAQCCYSLVPRALLFYWARQQYIKANVTEILFDIESESPHKPAQHQQPHDFANVVESISQPFSVLDWINAPAHCMSTIEKCFGSAETTQVLDQSKPELPIESTSKNVVVVVKAWEPPLAELHDYLQLIQQQSALSLFLFPADWNNETLRPPSSTHLDEWRRFAATLKGCQVLLPRDLIVNEAQISERKKEEAND